MTPEEELLKKRITNLETVVIGGFAIIEKSFPDDSEESKLINKMIEVFYKAQEKLGREFTKENAAFNTDD